jgi:hypothetical protein
MSRAATFAVNAVSESGLMSLGGKSLDYESIESTTHGWIATFEVFDCSPATTSCDKRSQGSVQVAIAEAEEMLAISDVTGAVTDRERTELLGYSEQPTLDPSWEAASVVQSGNLIESAIFWNGRIPALGVGSKCHAELLHQTEILWSGPTVDLGAPIQEEARSGGMVSFGGVPEELPGKPRVVCAPWRGEGWRAIGSVLSDASSGEAAVTTKVIWNAPAFRSAFSKCTISVFGDNNGVVDRETIFLDSPGQEEPGPPFEKELVTPVTLAAPADHAETECTLISAEEYERGEPTV